MEHRLWQYTSQKNTDWNLIARQLNVPTPYLIRHAAFLYETQLRGIQQQLRLGEMGRAKTTESATASGRSSRASRPSSALHADASNRPLSSTSMASAINQAGPSADNVSESMYMSTISSPQRNMMSPPNRPAVPRQSSHEKTPSPELKRRFTPTRQLETSSHSLNQSKLTREQNNGSPPGEEDDDDEQNNGSPPGEEDDDDDPRSTKTTSTDGSGVLQRSVPLDVWDRQELAGEGAADFAAEESGSNESDDNNENRHDYEEQFGRMYIEEDPAFLPSSARPSGGSSNRIMSMIKSVVIDRQSPFRNEPSSSSLPSSPHHQQPSATVERLATSPLKQERMQHLGVEESPTGGPSVSSSFSDVSDSSVTQSALEDAYMSKFNGSKMLFRNQYDNDVSTWSPQGRLHQLEYALEAVKQGSAAVGLRSKDYAILLGLKRSSGELASYQKKLIKVDDHMGIAIAGLTSDARDLSNFMRTEAMRSKMMFDQPLPVGRIVAAIGEKAQKRTVGYGERPFGVGLLVIGYDETGPHLYECSPSANNLEYYAMSIGARSQSAKTYLESKHTEFQDASLDDLVKHGLQALRDTLQQDKELSIENTSLGVVGKDRDFEIIEGEALQRYLDMIGDTGRPRRGQGAGTSAADAHLTEDVAPMDTDSV
ncbi:hypothetical protein INT43_002321 [Umbelopsis isabellina]|uniref:Proteasome alpha-type subunits domain-containing protein n=1 Tax=Mortierella isabellina TaxID=91625 RepID=A0A8H7Q4T2_MORIS|nr:hypothetical protein INT43_002321 [Umbelopsis isabellina]